MKSFIETTNSLKSRFVPYQVKYFYWQVKYWSQRFVAARYGLVKIENIWWDLKFGGLAGLTRPSRYKHLGAHGVRNVSYRPLEKLFACITINSDDVLVDVGCGKGRMINYWLRKKLPNKIVGIEIDEEVAAWVRNRLKSFSNVQIITGDAVANIPMDGSIFYMYNPFDENIMKRFSSRLTSLRGSGKRIAILYYAPQYANVFKNDSAWDVRKIEMDIYEPAYLITLKDA